MRQSMADTPSQDKAADAAIAAFGLAQMMFWQLLQKGLLEKSETAHMLEKLVEANLRGDRQHQLAALRLAGLLPPLEAYQPPVIRERPACSC